MSVPIAKFGNLLKKLRIKRYCSLYAGSCGNISCQLYCCLSFVTAAGSREQRCQLPPEHWSVNCKLYFPEKMFSMLKENLNLNETL